MSASPAQKEARDNLSKLKMTAAAKRHSRYLQYTREEAQAHGQSYYWTGKLCRNGHEDFRYTKSGACASCISRRAVKTLNKKLAQETPEISQYRMKLDRLLDLKKMEREL
jgi:hypothetical protein